MSQPRLNCLIRQISIIQMMADKAVRKEKSSLCSAFYESSTPKARFSLDFWSAPPDSPSSPPHSHSHTRTAWQKLHRKEMRGAGEQLNSAGDVLMWVPLRCNAAPLWRNLKVKYRIFDHLKPYGMKMCLGGRASARSENAKPNLIWTIMSTNPVIFNQREENFLKLLWTLLNNSEGLNVVEAEWDFTDIHLCQGIKMI